MKDRRATMQDKSILPLNPGCRSTVVLFKACGCRHRVDYSWLCKKLWRDSYYLQKRCPLHQGKPLPEECQKRVAEQKERRRRAAEKKHELRRKHYDSVRAASIARYEAMMAAAKERR